MNWNFVRARAISAMVSFTLFGCGGTDPNALNGYWMVSKVETQSMGSSQRQAEWVVPNDAAYVLSFQGNQMGIPSFGMGTQHFQLPDQGGQYQMEDDRISIGPSNYAPLEIVDVDDRTLTLSQAVTTEDQGNVRVQQEFTRVDPERVRNMMMARNEPLPPELQQGYGGNGQGGPQYGNGQGRPPMNGGGRPGMGQPGMQGQPMPGGVQGGVPPQGYRGAPQGGPQGVQPNNGGIAPPSQRGYVPLEVPGGVQTGPTAQPQYGNQGAPQGPSNGANGPNGGFQGQPGQPGQGIPQEALQSGVNPQGQPQGGPNGR